MSRLSHKSRVSRRYAQGAHSCLARQGSSGGKSSNQSHPTVSFFFAASSQATTPWTFLVVINWARQACAAAWEGSRNDSRPFVSPAWSINKSICMPDTHSSFAINSEENPAPRLRASAPPDDLNVRVQDQIPVLSSEKDLPEIFLPVRSMDFVPFVERLDTLFSSMRKIVLLQLFRLRSYPPKISLYMRRETTPYTFASRVEALGR